MPKNNKTAFRIVDKAEAYEMYIYSDIEKPGWWDEDTVDAETVIDAIHEAGGKPIDLHVNSGGGDVFEAFAIYTALSNYDARVTAYVDGMAASSASLVICAADEVVMAPVAWVMMHEPSGMAWGQAGELRKQADLLDSIGKTFADAYTRRSPDHDWRADMAAETWYDAETAVDLGIADRIGDGLLAAAASVHTSDRATLDHLPEQLRDRVCRSIAPEPGVIEREPEADASGEPAAIIGTDSAEGADIPDGQTQEGAAVCIAGKIYYIQQKEV